MEQQYEKSYLGNLCYFDRMVMDNQLTWLIDDFYTTCRSADKEENSKVHSTFLPPYSCMTAFKV